MDYLEVLRIIKVVLSKGAGTGGKGSFCGGVTVVLRNTHTYTYIENFVMSPGVNG